MTLAQARALYERAVDRDGQWDDDIWASEVVTEMRAVVAAETDKDAAKVIAWWGSMPDDKPSPLTVARRIRRVWTKMQAKEEPQQ